MSDDKDEADASEWLSSQFDSTSRVPAQPAPPSSPPVLIPPPASYRGDPPTQPYAATPTLPFSQDAFPPAPVPDRAGSSHLEQPTQQYTVQPWAPTGAGSAPPALPRQPAEPASPLDALFGESQFQEYEELGVIGSIQVPSTVGAVRSAREPRGPLSTRAKTLLSIAGGLLAALVVIALFFLGTRLGAAPTADPSPAASAHPSATPTSASEGGPAAPGVQLWTALQGGECIEPFTSAWAEKFTVVPCTSNHQAEMVFKGKLPDSSSAPYPTSGQFQTTLTALCRASSAINYAAAASITDLQISYSYPPDASSWKSGDRTYYCFVNRQSGSNLPGDLAVAKTP